MYKELNGDVGIKFPIKVDIAQNPHKVSLLMQSELGGCLFPNHEKWKKHRTQFNIDRNMVFSHVNRLIRCIIDCQLQLEDAVSVRHGLELARSLAARVWDNSPFQMKQIDSIGEAGVRKLAQAGISSIETLQSTEPHRIEHILGRHPPFGQKLLAKAADFPNLHVSVKEMGKERDPGNCIKIKFKAEVGFVNENLPITFHKKPVYVCFLAETSDGKLIDFRRFAAKKLEHGQEILLSVQLIRPTTSINCHIMCDEIAGTSRRAELRLEHFPASYFPAPEPTASKPILPVHSKAVTTEKTASNNPPVVEDYGYLDDADLLAVLDQEQSIEVIHDIDQVTLDSDKPASKSLKRAADKISVDQKGELKTYKEPVQLANGNWTCQHTCKEDGKSCKHKCCVEGVEKPAKPGRKKAAKKDIASKSCSDNSAAQKYEKLTSSEKPCSQSEAREQNSRLLSTSGTNSSRKHFESASQKSQQATSIQPKMSMYSYERGSAPKLSFLQNPYGLSQSPSSTVDVSANQEAEHSQAFDLNPPKQVGRHSNCVSNVDIVVKRNDVINGTMTSLADPSEISKPLGPDPGINTNSPNSECYKNGSDYQLAGSMAFTITEGAEHAATARTLSRTDSTHYQSSSGLGNEAGIEAVDAPIRRISPEVSQRVAQVASDCNAHCSRTFKPQEKGLFITGESSSPDKAMPQGSVAVEAVEDNFDGAIEAFFASLDAADYDVAEPPKKKKQKLDQDTEEETTCPRALPELQDSSARTSSSVADPTMYRQPLTSLQHGRNYQPTALKEDPSDAHQDMLMVEDSKEKEAEGRHGKKWEGLEDFYEQFGDYVEIMD